MPIAWGYVRVSDELQLGRKTVSNGSVVDDTSLATQKRMILKWWDENRHRFPNHQFATDADGNPAFWEDPAQSGRQIPLARRPQGSKMLAAVDQDDIIIVWEMSRVFRNTIDTLTTLSRLAEKNVTFEPLRGPKPSQKSAEDRFSTTVLAAVNELASDHTSERCRDVYVSREEVGRVAGRGIPLGWKKRYTIDRDTGRKMIHFVPCARERGWLLIFKHMRECGITQEKFQLIRTRIPLRRGEKGKQRYWYWAEFNLAAFVITENYPLKILVQHDQGYRRDRISDSVVRVRKRSAHASRRPSPPAASVPAEALLQSPAWTSIWKLRRSQCLEQAQPAAAAEVQPPGS